MNTLKIRDKRRNFIMTFVDRVVGIPFKIVSLVIGQDKVDLRQIDLKKILLLRTDNIGDVLLLTPTINALRRKYPSARIDILVRPPAKDVITKNPDIDDVLISRVPWFMNNATSKDFIDLIKDVSHIRKQCYDLIIDFRGDFRNIFFYLYLGGGRYRLSSDRSGGIYFLTHVVDFNEDIHAIDKNFSLLSPLGITPSDRSMRMYITENDRIALGDKVGNLNLDGHYLIGIHPGASSMTRRWPIGRFANVVNELSNKLPCKFFVSGDNSEKDIGANLNRLTNGKIYDFTGKLTILELAALLEKAALFICNENGIMHLAVALKTKTISIYGPQLPEKYGHINENSQILWKKFACCPCLHHYSCEKTNTSMALCLDAITVDEVVTCALQMLERESAV